MKHLLYKTFLFIALIFCSAHSLHIYGTNTITKKGGTYNSNSIYAPFISPEIATNSSAPTTLNMVPLKSYPETDQLYQLMRKVHSSISIDKDSVVLYLQKLDNLYKNSDSYLTKALSSVYMADILNLYYRDNRYAIDERTELVNDKLEDIKEWSKGNFTSQVEKYIKEALHNASLVKDIPFQSIERFTDFNKENIYRFKNQKASDLIYLKSIDMINNLLLSQNNNNYIFYLSKNQIDFMFNENHEFVKPDFCKNTLIVLFLNAYSELIGVNRSEPSSIVYEIKKYTDLTNLLKYNSYGRNIATSNYNKFINQTYFDKIVSFFDKYKNSDQCLNFITTNDHIESFPLSLYVADFYLTELLPDDISTNASSKNKINENKITELVNYLKPLSERYSDNYLVCSIKKRLINLYSASLSVSIKELSPVTKNVPIEIQYKNVTSFLMTVFNEKGDKVYSANFDLDKNVTINKEDTTLYISQLDFGEYNVEIKPLYTPIELFDKDEFRENNPIKKISFTVSSLFAYYTIAENKGIFVITNSKTGKPEANAVVDIYDQNIASQKDKYSKKASYKTNKLGIVEIPVPSQNVLFYKVSKGADIYFPISRAFGSYRNYGSTSGNSYNILLDRSVYRPGQIMHFKIFDSQYKDNEYIPAKNKNLEVELRDVNNNVVSKKSLVTDSYGAIWGTFNLPQNTLNGEFSINVNNSQKSFLVEDYKRPIMTLDFEEDQKFCLWGDTVDLKGTVKTYSGAPLSGALLNYNIRYSLNGWGDSFEIKQSEIEANQAGEFQIKFPIEVPFSKLFDINSGSFNISIIVTDAAGNIINAYKRINILDPQFSLKPTFSDLFYGITSSGYLSVLKSPDIIRFIQKDKLSKFQIGVPMIFNKDSYGSFTAYKLDKRVSTNISSYLKNNEILESSLSAFCDSIIINDKLKVYYHNDVTINKSYDFSQDIEGSENYIFKASYKYRGVSYDTYEIVSVIDETIKKIPFNDVDLLIYSKNINLKYGEKGKVIFGSSLDGVNILCEIIGDNGELYERKSISNNIREIDFTYKKEYGESVLMILSFVKDSKFYYNTIRFERRSDEQPLRIETKSFRDKLTPGMAEKWEFVIKKGDSIAKSQVLASMYDASLNEFQKNVWNFNLDKKPALRRFNIGSKNIYNSQINFSKRVFLNCKAPELVSISDFDISGIFLRNYLYTSSAGVMTKSLKARAASNKEDLLYESVASVSDGVIEEKEVSNEIYSLVEPSSIIGGKRNNKSENVAPIGNFRKNLDETAFFYPNLMTDKDGNVVISFNAPEALTEWDFNMLAVTEELQSALYTAKVKTSKQFMVKPNMPLFIYDSDKINIPVILSNLEDTSSNGDIIMELFNPYNNEILSRSKKPFNIDPQTSKTITFAVSAPKGCELMGVRFIGSDGKFSDGEQSVVPVLTSKALVTESMSIYTEQGNNNFYFKSFDKNYYTDEKSNYKYIIEYCANPAWYAVKALPAIKDVTDNNAINAIKAFYSNTLASYLANSVPEIENAIKLWNKAGIKESGFESNLIKNQELMNLILNQTPWVLEANNEKENIESLISLFDENRINNVRESAINLLEKLQNYDGGFSYCQGCTSSLYLTLNILDNFSRLIKMEAVEYNEKERIIINHALNYVDNVVSSRFNSFKANFPTKKYIPNSTDIFWAYLRGDFMDIPLGQSLETHNYIIDNMRKQKKHSLYEMALYSLTFRNFGFTSEADKLVNDLKKYSVTSKDKGIYWPNNRPIFNSNTSAISAHVMFMNAIVAAGTNTQEINKLKQWLLTEKQAVMWSNVTTTLDAIYGILMQGDNWISSEKSSEVYAGKIELKPSPVLGSVDSVFTGNSLNPSLANIKIEQNSSHPGFGAAYWQYFQSYDKIKPTSNEVRITKELYKVIKENGKESLVKTNEYSVGDVVVSRIVVTSERDVSFVLVKDLRASCFSPASYISGYNTNRSVNYYEETKDASTNLFIDYLPKGTFVFENRMFCTYSGSFVDGIATVQSVYLPQFTANSRGGVVEINE